MRGTWLLVVAAFLLPSTAHADEIELPTSKAAQLAATELLKQLPNFRPDRLLPSDVPGPVVNDERLEVALDGAGRVQSVLLEQRLQLMGTGDYAIRERGPARSATSLTADAAPVTRRGAVVWQGFSPGTRDLAARMVLDPAIEAARLPLSLRVAFTPAGGGARTLEPGGVIPGAGTVTITVVNDTSQPAVLPSGSDVAATAVAAHLDRALAVASRPSAARLPNTDTGLPARLTVTGAGRVQSAQAVPFRLTGALQVTGTTASVSGPATTAVDGGASFAGVLGGVSGAHEVTFTVVTQGRGTLALELTAHAALDPRVLAPPRGFSSWRRWATSRPPVSERKAALDLLVEVAATGARATSYSPYLGAELAGSGSTTFRYTFAPPVRQAAAGAPLEPRWGAIALAGLGLLLLAVAGAATWRRL